jgi:hypothetical protein
MVSYDDDVHEVPTWFECWDDRVRKWTSVRCRGWVGMFFLDPGGDVWDWWSVGPHASGWNFGIQS